MKPGLKVGQTAEVEIIVSPDMRAAFEEQTAHDLYATYQLVQHMEWVARKTVLPYIESNEESMGSHLELSHLKPALTGMKVKLKATVKEILNNKVFCEIEASTSLGKIARGSVTQTIVEKEWLLKKKKEMSLIDHLVQDATKPSVKA